MISLLPKDWRKLRNIGKGRWRIYTSIERYEHPSCRYQLNDDAYATCIGFATQQEASDAARFAREYIKIHGDIDLRAFPYELTDSLHYDGVESTKQWWDEMRERHEDR